jgi:hypothetical protein
MDDEIKMVTRLIGGLITPILKDLDISNIQILEDAY